MGAKRGTDMGRRSAGAHERTGGNNLFLIGTRTARLERNREGAREGAAAKRRREGLRTQSGGKDAEWGKPAEGEDEEVVFYLGLGR